MDRVIETNIPEWADKRLSRDLPVLRSCGESQELEYKKIFPKNTRDLAKEIAAFATSNTGIILIGVSDSGDLVGLPSCQSSEGRDKILERLGGITRGTVKPSITPTAKFALEDDSVVLVVTVPKGKEPIYYSSDIPYIRHLTEARPANPHEVVERITEHLERRDISLAESESLAEVVSDEKIEMYSDLAQFLVDVLIFADQFEEREVNPWLDMWRSEFGYTASELRDLAASQFSVDEGIDSELKELSDLLDHVATLRLTLGSGDDLRSATEAASEQAGDIFERYVGEVALSKSSLSHIREAIITSSRKLQDLSSRAEEMSNSGHLEELQTEASDLGHLILKASYYNIDSFGEGIKKLLRSVGRSLHLTETMRLYMDGGISMQAVVDRVQCCNEDLQSIIGKLE